jgi:Tn3 transposase DDE domain
MAEAQGRFTKSGFLATFGDRARRRRQTSSRYEEERCPLLRKGLTCTALSPKAAKSPKVAKNHNLRLYTQPQLRSAIAPVGGKKGLTGRTDVEIEISNPCARLMANAIIYYNSAILSRLLTKYEASGNAKALALIKKMSPAAWRHIHLKRALHLPWRRTAHRPGCDRGGTGIGVTEFSGVWAYNPCFANRVPRP